MFALGQNPNLTASSVSGISAGLDSAFEGRLLASEGKATRSTHFIQAAENTPCYIACIRPGLLFINDVYIKGVVSQEIYVHTAAQGDKIKVRGGSCFPIYRNAVNQTPFEANNPSQAGKVFFWNHFRNSPSQDFISALLPVDTSIQIYGPNPTFTNGVIDDTPQHDLVIPAEGIVTPDIVGTGEYYMEADFEVLISSTTNNESRDPRTVPPPARKLIGCIRSGGGNNFSSLRVGNTATIRLRNGAIGTFTASPGSPAKIDEPSGYDTGSVPTNTDFFQDSIGIFEAPGEGNLYAGADSAGVNAVQWMSTETASNVFVLPLDIQERGSLNDQCVIMSEYECEAYVYNPDGSYRGKINVRRGNANSSASPATTVDHQRFPAAVNFAPNEGIFAGQGTMPAGTMFILNMPGFMICNFTQTTDAMAQDDETPVFGDTIEDHLCETRIRQTDGLKLRKVFDDNLNTFSWVAA